MLNAMPNFHFFSCGNNYCGEHLGMRYYLGKTKEGEEDCFEAIEPRWRSRPGRFFHIPRKGFSRAVSGSLSSMRREKSGGTNAAPRNGAFTECVGL